MEITNLRASSISTYRDCAWRYYLYFVCWFVSIAGKKADLGSIAHLVLQLLANAKKTGHYKLHDKYTDPDYLLDIVWQRYQKISVHAAEMTPADKKFCRKQVQIILDSKFNPLNLKILRTEHQFEITMLHNGFQYQRPDGSQTNILLRGTMDLVIEQDKDTIEIIDYKTGKRLDWITGETKEYEEFFKELQLRIYNLASSILYKQYKYRMLTIFFTQDGGPFTVTFTEENIYETIDTLRQAFQKIRIDNKYERLIDDNTRRNEQWKCKYVCQFGKIVISYADDDGNVVDAHYKFDKTGSYPDQIVRDGKKYYQVSEVPETLCDRYRRLFNQNSVSQATVKLQAIAIDESLKLSISRRNNYNNPHISKETLK